MATNRLTLKALLLAGSLLAAPLVAHAQDAGYFAQITYTSTGGATYAIPFPYLQQSDIQVYENGVLQASSAYTFPTTGQVTLTTAPAAGVVVQVRRLTAEASPDAVFSGGSLASASLNVNKLQDLYGIQEARDNEARLQIEINSIVVNPSANGQFVSLNNFPGVDPTGNSANAATNSAAIAAAIASGASLYCNGTYAISSGFSLTQTANHGQQIVGVGPNSSLGTTADRCTFKPVSGFTGFVFTVDGTPTSQYIEGVGFENLAVDLTNVSDVGTNGGFHQIQAFDQHYSNVRVLGDYVGNLTQRATTGASGTGTTATITFANPVTYAVGQLVEVNGVTPTGYNGVFTVTAASSGSVSYANTTTGSQTVAGTVSGAKESWRFSAGAYTTTMLNTQGQVVNMQGAAFGNGATTLSLINHDGFQFIMNYSNGVKLWGGSYQGAGSHFSFSNSGDVDISTDVEGSGTYLTLSGYTSFIRSYASLGGMASGYTKYVGTCTRACIFWDDDAVSETYPSTQLSTGGIRLNNQGVAGGYSSFLSGSSSQNYSVELGTAQASWLIGTSGTNGDYFGSVAAGDAVIEGLSTTGNIWITAYQNAYAANIKVTPTGVNINGGTTGSGTFPAGLSSGFATFTAAQVLPPTDGQLFTLKNAAGTAFMLCSSFATVGSSNCQVLNGADWEGFSDNGITRTYDLNAATGVLLSTGAASLGGLTLTNLTGGPYCLQQTAGVVSSTGSACGSGGSSGANPTATIGLSAVNGSATTFLRSDGAPALSQAITPTWTGLHKFTNSDLALLGSSTGYLTFTSANASGTNYTVTFPAATDTLAELTQAQTLTNKTIAYASNTLTGVAPTASPTFTGTVTGPDGGTWGSSGITSTFSGAHNGTVGATTPATGAFTTLSTTGTISDAGSLQVGAGNSVNWSGHGAITSAALGTLQLGYTDQAAPLAETITTQSVIAGTANTPGVSITFNGSKSTGSGLGGPIIFQTSLATAASTTQNSELPVLTLDGSQHGTFGNTTSTPTVGTGAASIGANSTDQRMLIVTGSAVTSITVNFGKTWINRPVCTVTEESAAPVALGLSSVSTSAVTISAVSALTSVTLDLLCQ